MILISATLKLKINEKEVGFERLLGRNFRKKMYKMRNMRRTRDYIFNSITLAHGSNQKLRRKTTKKFTFFFYHRIFNLKQTNSFIRPVRFQSSNYLNTFFFLRYLQNGGADSV